MGNKIEWDWEAFLTEDDVAELNEMNSAECVLQMEVDTLEEQITDIQARMSSIRAEATSRARSARTKRKVFKI